MGTRINYVWEIKRRDKRGLQEDGKRMGLVEVHKVLLVGKEK